MLEYETANPGQDFDEKEQENFDPERDTSRPSPVVKFEPSEALDDKQHGEPRNLSSGSGGLYHPDAVVAHATPKPDIAGPGEDRHGDISALQGKRKEPGFSPAEDARRKGRDNLAGSYEEGPRAESGSHAREDVR